MRVIEFDGITHEFPEDITDDEIQVALGGGAPAPPTEQASAGDLSAAPRLEVPPQHQPSIIPFQRADKSKGVFDDGEGIGGSNIKYTGSTLVDALAGAPRAIFDTMKEGGEALQGKREMTPEIALNSAMLVAGGPRLSTAVKAVDKAAATPARLRIAPQEAAPTRAVIKEASENAYKTAEDAGVAVSPQSFFDFVADVEKDLAKSGIDKTLHPDATAALKRLQDAAASGEPQTLQQMEILRRVAGEARNDAVKEGDASKAGKIVKGIDDFVNKLDGSHLVSGDPDAAVPALQGARDLWRKNAKMGEIEKIVTIAAREDDPSKYIKGQFRKISRDPDWFGQFSPDEQKLITEIQRTGAIESIGKLAPDMSLTGIAKMGAYGAGALANPLVAALPAAGIIAERAAKAGRTANVKDLTDLVATGAPKKSLAERISFGPPQKSGPPLLEESAPAEQMRLAIERAPRKASYMNSPSGSVDWGGISGEAVAASGGKLRDLPIRVDAGVKGYSVDHLKPERIERVQKLGFADVPEFIDYVSKNHNMIVEQPNGRLGLVVSPGQGKTRTNKTAHNYMAIELQPSGDHYGVTTILPDATERYLNSGGKKTLWRRGAYPTK